ncbi:MAG: hypothetical protein LBT41_03040 [Candidatus Methanoplasma sp.]|nr:hypothetical protein [Candidatus Methanoplasma sp.]
MRPNTEAAGTAVIALVIVLLLVAGAGAYYIASNSSDDSHEPISEINFGPGTYFDYTVSGESSGYALSGTYKLEIVGTSAVNGLRYMTPDIYATTENGRIPLMQDAEYDLMTPEKEAELDAKEIGNATLDTVDGKVKTTILQLDNDGVESKMYVGSNGIPYRQTQTISAANMELVMDLSGYAIIEKEPTDDPYPVGTVFEYGVSATYGVETLEGIASMNYVAYDEDGYWVWTTTSIEGHSEEQFTHHDWSESDSDDYADTGSTAEINTIDGRKTLSVAEDAYGNRIYGDESSGIVYRMTITEGGVYMVMDLTYYKAGTHTGGVKSTDGGGSGLS